MRSYLTPTVPTLLALALLPAAPVAAKPGITDSSGRMPISVAFDEAVFDLGMLAGERDTIPEVFAGSLGSLDWPAERTGAAT